jgi:hypothetical protein
LTVKTIFANIDLEKHLGVKMSTIEALAQQSCEELSDTEFFNALRDAEDIAALGIEYARDVHSLLGKILQDAEQ